MRTSRHLLFHYISFNLYSVHHWSWNFVYSLSYIFTLPYCVYRSAVIQLLSTEGNRSTIYTSSHHKWKAVKRAIIKFCEGNFHTETKTLKASIVVIRRGKSGIVRLVWEKRAKKQNSHIHLQYRKTFQRVKRHMKNGREQKITTYYQ